MMIGKGKGVFARRLLLSLFTWRKSSSADAAFSPTARPGLRLLQHTLRSGQAATTTASTASFGGVHLQRCSPRRHVRMLAKQQDNKDNNDEEDTKEEKQTKNNPFRFLLHPYESKIPNELRDEIMQAESQTTAAQNRSQRVTIYAVVACLGVLAAFFNGFISELRSSNPPDEFIQGVIQDSITYSDNALNAQDFVFDMQMAGFGWIESNFVTKFLFLNKIGGAVCLLGGAGAGLLAEAELDTRRINAEKIYEEMERRRQERDRKGNSSSRNERNDSKQRKKKKGLSGKERKRIDALSEVVTMADASIITTDDAANDPTIIIAAAENTTVKEEEPSPKKQDSGVGVGGVLDTIKGFYKQADNMAASQALLLNKKLEDAGVLEKITDETGFKVIGKEKAAAIKNNSGNKDSSNSQVETKTGDS